MSQRRLLAVATGAAVLAGAVLMLRSGVRPPPAPVTAPDGQRISAYHDPALVTPPLRPEEPPRQPGRLRTDARRDGALVSWSPAPYAFEVRWTPAGDPARTRTRYVATPGTSLDGLAPGRYRVEVRSVDEVGRRSEPSGADIEVSGAVPPWQQGLGFAEDFAGGAALDADRWRLTDGARRCLRREGNPGPILLDGRCGGGALTPDTALELADRHGDEVRGRVVVVAEAPSPPQATPWGFPDRPTDEGANFLVLAVSPESSPSQPLGFAVAPVQLWIGSRGAFLAADEAGVSRWPPGQRLDLPQPAALGAPRRWELAFTAGEVIVYLDGDRVGSAPYQPSWRRADVQLSAYIATDGAVPPAARVAFVGLTGPPPDGRPVRLLDLSPTSNPGTEQRLTLPKLAAVETARLTALVAGTDPNGNPGNSTGPPPAPEVRADLDGRPLELVRHPSTFPGEPTAGLSGDVPPGALASGGTVTLRSADGSPFVAFNAELEIRYPRGTPVDAQQPTVVEPASEPALPQPRLRIRSGERAVTGSDPAPRGTLDVEVSVDAAAAQAAGRSLAGWVALRVELDGRRILDFPTATDGPATMGTYRFTLDTTTLPEGYYPLVVTLVPDRAGVRATTDRATLRLGA